MGNLSMTLHPDLTSRDEDLNPFWNDVSTVIHASLWQPHQIALQEQDLVSSEESLNYLEEKFDFWKKMKRPKISTQQLSLASSQALSHHITEKERQDEEVTATRKIRIYPQKEEQFFKLLHLHRRAYNLSIEAFKGGERPSSPLRKRIVDQANSEMPEISNYDLCAEAYRTATKTLDRVIKLRRKGKKAEISFMSWKYSPKYFILMKYRVAFLKKIVGEVVYGESIPDEAIGRVATVTYEDGEWYVNLTKSVTTKGVVLGDSQNIVALDPGVRTFQTSYSENQSVKYGEMFAQERLLPIVLKLRAYLSHRDYINKLVKEHCSDLKFSEYPQHVRDFIVHVNRKIDRLRSRKRHLVNDLHRRVAYDIVKSHDIILLPTFTTSRMVRKAKNPGDRVRKIRKISVNEMLNLAHYKFKLTLKWMAKKYGKVVIDVNEAYTSKTRPDGTVDVNL